MNKIELKPGIVIEGFSFDKSCNYLQRIIDLSDNIIYEGKTSEIPEEIAKECVYSYQPNWSDYTLYYNYHHTPSYHPRNFEDVKESIQSACSQEFCIIYKTI